MTDLKPGDEVVCVDVKPVPGSKWPSGSAPVHKGQNYIVREAGLAGINEGSHVRLCGVSYDIPQGWQYEGTIDLPLLSYRFRHVQYDTDEELVRATTALDVDISLAALERLLGIRT